jgi:hypothetical protein
MTIDDLPRPWLLAALADVSIIELTRPRAQDAPDDERERALPRADQRRQRLAGWRAAGHRHSEGDRPN